MELEVAIFSAGSFFGQPRTFLMDSAIVAFRDRHFSFLAQSTPNWRSGVVRSADLLLFHRVVSGLGRDFIVREPFFCLAHSALRDRTSYANRENRRVLQFPEGGHDRRFSRSSVLFGLEPWFDVSVGLSFDCPARTGILGRSREQPVSHRASPDHQATARLSVPTQADDAQHRTARRPAVEGPVHLLASYRPSKTAYFCASLVTYTNVRFTTNFYLPKP